MTDRQQNELEEDLIIVMTDDDGNEFYYREDMIVPLNEKNFAILVPLDIEEECEENGTLSESLEEETDVYIARIEVDEQGEEVYVDPTDEEFDLVREEYERLMAELEETD